MRIYIVPADTPCTHMMAAADGSLFQTYEQEIFDKAAEVGATAIMHGLSPRLHEELGDIPLPYVYDEPTPAPQEEVPGG